MTLPTLPLHIFNTLLKKKVLFTPLEPGKVRMYVCGMTVYDFCHLGHARVMVVFDIVRRWLVAQGLDVIYVRNITDIDDKIIHRALENGESIRDLTNRFISAMHQDADALGVQRPDFEPRATDYIPHMLGMVSQLMDKGLAYQVDGGDVNFAVRKFSAYGQLSGKSVDDLRAGERVPVVDSKQDPLDFVLWKKAKEGEPADATWPSVYGAGRPGWHIECSAMSCALLGNTFDIHGGGADLQFPHHENEIAQSEGASGVKFANIWMHNGFVRVENNGISEKMSKSLNNFFTISDILSRYDPEVVRFFIARAQYRSPLAYSEHTLEDAKQALGGLYAGLKQTPPDTTMTIIDWNQPQAQRFARAMNDDFNTPEALAVLFELSTQANRNNDGKASALLKQLAAIVGLLEREPDQFLQASVGENTLLESEILRKIEERKQAKAVKNFALADQLRADLLVQGIVLEDRHGGLTEWRRA